MKEPLRIAVLLSGSGTNLQAIIDAIGKGLNARIVQVVASRPEAGGIKRAKAAGIPVLVMQKSDYDDPEAADAAIVEAVRAADAEYIIMAGYMRKVSPVLLGAYPNRVVNLHPALLPSFVGAHAIQDAFEYGVKLTGVTVHFANEEYDKGPIIAQRAVPVYCSDSLEGLEMRIHATEHELYPQVIEWLADGRVSVGADGKVRIK
jgi:phosphoribosylglycinamide formyltransferase-1